MGMLGDALKVAVAAAPERGKANAAVIIEVLAEFFGVREGQIELVGGQTQPRKTFLINGVSEANFREKLQDLQ